MKQIDLYARCGALGHTWDDDPWEGSTWKPEFGMPLVIRCVHCTSERRDVIGTNGRLIARHYWHPANYKWDPGMRPTRDDFRVAFMKQYNKGVKQLRAEQRASKAK
jgi:hypothetical protein